MNKKFPVSIFFLLILSFIYAQDSGIHATMDTEEALYFNALYPEKVRILSSNEKESAVILLEGADEIIRESVQTHGSGFIFRPSEEQALRYIELQARPFTELEYTITEDELVNHCLDLVDVSKIEETILTLEGYGTRYHTKPQAEQAVLDLQAKWDAMIALSGRTDISTRIYNHVNTPMPSLILTITGADNPEEFVIVGGHIDSTSWDRDDAPGADDNASGIASLDEMFRVLLEGEFVPNRTVEIMAFAAEEIGLVGSAEIASNYANNGVDVLAYVQFDMTGYKGSSKDIYISEDWYVNQDVNTYLIQLLDHYNASGPHSLTYGFTECGYGCSDHASWAAEGYKVAFPFEAAFHQSNPNIHTPYDLFSFLETGDHAAKFTKLGLEFIIEGAKSQTLSVSDYSTPSVKSFIKNKTLFFELKNTASHLKEVELFNMAGRKLVKSQIKTEQPFIDLQSLSSGFYIVRFTLDNQQVFTEKIILN